MTAPAELFICPSCDTQMNVSELGFFAELECPICGGVYRVHDTLANFRIDGILGVGGMSVVFSARDLVLGRELAIKVLNDIYRDNPERINRFEQECAMMARVRHENVVSVYSAGWSRGQFYIAMEKVAGRNLELLLAEHKCLMQDEALDVIRQIASGLKAAQEVGILHRDMKPGNVIITPEGQAKVLDFGLALEDRPDAVREEIIWATPFFVPPETLEGKTEDARTDIYALGMTLRSMVTGVTNFSESLHELSALLEKKRDLKPMTALYPNMDEGVCDLIDHMTAFDPKDRPANYEELLDEIAEVQNSVGGVAVEMKKHRRRKLRCLLGGFAVVLLGGISALCVALLTSPPPIEEFVDIPSQLQWSERDALLGACELFEDGDVDSAGESFRELFEKSTTPAVKLAAFLMLGLADGMSNVSPEFLQQFKELIAGAESGNSSDFALAERCKTIPSLIENRQLTPESLSPELSAPLRSAILLLGARYSVKQGDGETASRCLNAAMECMSLSPITCTLVESMRTQLRNLPGIMAQQMRQQVRVYMRSGELAVALESLRKMDTSHFSPLEQAEHAVQMEYCKVAIEAFDLLKRKFPEEFRPNATPDELKVLAAQLGNAQLADELYSLVCLLQGDYVRAFESNPYKDKTDSRNPFAILMRDWKQRLGM